MTTPGVPAHKRMSIITDVDRTSLVPNPAPNHASSSRANAEAGSQSHEGTQSTRTSTLVGRGSNDKQNEILTQLAVLGKEKETGHGEADIPVPVVTENLNDETKSDYNVAVVETPASENGPMKFRLYRRRYLGLAALFFLNVAAGLCYPWFGPIADDTAVAFNITLSQVNWLSNTMSVVYLPCALLMPTLCARFGIRGTCAIGSVCLIAASWVRFVGTLKGVSSSSFAVLVVSQVIGGFAQPIYQVLGPKYSELWFDIKERTTVTMILAIANPIGNGIGQLLSPEVGSVEDSILVLAIICSAIAPLSFFVGSAPPTPPTYAGSLPSQSMSSLLRAWVGLPTPAEAYMSPRERIDFGLLFAVFSMLVGAVGAISDLTNQWFQPVGYSADTAGFLGATLLLAGLFAAAVSAPLFDRVLTSHLAITIKVLCPILGAAWLSLIWAVRPNNEIALYVIMAVIGCASLTLLPVSLELAIELTRNAEASSALLFFGGNGLGFIFVLVEDVLRAGANASPPLNMRKAIMFQSITVCAVCFSVLGIRGRQMRRQLDEARALGRPDPEVEPGTPWSPRFPRGEGSPFRFPSMTALNSAPLSPRLQRSVTFEPRLGPRPPGRSPLTPIPHSAV